MKKFIIILQLDGSETKLSWSDLPIVIGSAPKAHIKLPESAPEISYIGEAEGHVFIQPGGKNEPPIFHNDYQLSQSAWLKSNDTIQSGDSCITYKMVGDKMLFTVATVENQELSQTLRPPKGPPPSKTERSRTIPVQVTESTASMRSVKLLKGGIAVTFLLLGFAVLFVLLARPLEIYINPAPEKITVSGFPPAIKIGSRYLCLPGTYSITAEKTGYFLLEHNLLMSKKADNIFTATFEKLPGILNLQVHPGEGIAVYSKERLIGTTPPNTMEISPGRHTLTLHKKRYKSITTEIEIAGEGQTQDLEAVLQPDWATITITSVPEGAAVSINTTPYGNTPLTLELTSGDHTIFLTKELYTRMEAGIAVVAEKDETHTFELQLLPARLQLMSSPSQAAVTIGNIYRGTTPLIIPLAAKEQHQILLAKPGFISKEQKISLEPGEDRQVEFLLDQEYGIVFLHTDPPHASIRINGKKQKRNQGEFTLPVVPHTLEVNAPGFIPVTRALLPKAGFSQQISISLTPQGRAIAAGSPNKTSESEMKTAGGQKLVYVEPSPFVMGAPRREPGRRSNERERKVEMKRPFYLADKPVSNRQYRMFNKKHFSGNYAGHSLNGDDQPVVNVSWEDAVRYLNWLSEQDTLEPFYIAKDTTFIPSTPPTNGYRLPTEAEWAFCARQLGYKRQQRFPWEGAFPPRRVTGNFADESARTFLPNIISGYNDKFPVSSPIGAFPANRGGFFDMGTNIGEWCHDYYTPNSRAFTKQTDPLGPISGKHRVIRGASWRDASVTELRLSYRAYHREPRDNVGFRIARYK